MNNILANSQPIYSLKISQSIRIMYITISYIILTDTCPLTCAIYSSLRSNRQTKTMPLKKSYPFID